MNDQSSLEQAVSRPAVRGKSFWLGERKLIVKGVTYGPFSSEADGGFDPATAARDFAQMAVAGINAIRLYTSPPAWMLDLALEHGLHVMVGIPWEQHVAFLDTGAADGIELRVRETVRACAGHPAVLCYSVGNEIPSSIVRWHGRSRTERFLERLCEAARDEDPGGLVTYVNFPPTEYLRLSCFDLLAFNVYLEHRERLEAYLARLQNVADDRPLLIAEIGLDSARNGEQAQAESLQWQLEACAQAGCAGTFVFAWTDEWDRGGYEVLDWDFGLTTRARDRKPALAVVSAAARSELRLSAEQPSFSVAVCTYNGSRTLPACLEGISALRYPDYEVVVVSDGSSDASAQIARSFEGVRVIETPNRGLAAARNTAMELARGEIVAYVDDDAVPDPDWLTHLAATFAAGDYAAVGGPNVPPPGASRVAQCVANAPGGPTHVLISDREAEHIPGCNMAVRKRDLRRIGGFDPQFHVAGDDVDMCWRLLDSGRLIGFSFGAVVHHHRRASIRGYLRQQRGYGKAEALLERKHPEKYSALGHVTWAGQLYGNGAAQHRGSWRWRVYYGSWGTAFYQSIYGPRRNLLDSLPLMPEWYLVIALLSCISVAGAFWMPALLAVPLLGAAVAALIIDAGHGAARARFESRRHTRRLRALTGLLYLLQPLERLRGRLLYGLTPWRRRARRGLVLPRARERTFWSERWQGTEDRVRALSGALGAEGAVVRSGGPWDRWDLQVRGGLIGSARMRLAIEEHGAGNQLVRLRAWPHLGARAVTLATALAVVGALAGAGGAISAAAVFGAVALALLGRGLYECAAAVATIDAVLPAALADACADGPAECCHDTRSFAPLPVALAGGAHAPEHASESETARPLLVASRSYVVASTRALGAWAHPSDK